VHHLIQSRYGRGIGFRELANWVARLGALGEARHYLRRTIDKGRSVTELRVKIADAEERRQVIALLVHEHQAVFEDGTGIALVALCAVCSDSGDAPATHHAIADAHAQIDDGKVADDGVLIEQRLDARAVLDRRTPDGQHGPLLRMLARLYTGYERVQAGHALRRDGIGARVETC